MLDSTFAGQACNLQLSFPPSRVSRPLVSRIASPWPRTRRLSCAFFLSTSGATLRAPGATSVSFPHFPPHVPPRFPPLLPDPPPTSRPSSPPFAPPCTPPFTPFDNPSHFATTISMHQSPSLRLRIATLRFVRLVSFVRHAYMIDPRTKRQGEPYLAYNQRRWGGDGWTTSLRRSGARSGLKFADWQWWPHTLNAHRLVHAATQQGKGSEAKQRLFEMTYEEGRNVSDASELAAAAADLGLFHIDSAAYFESEEGKQEVLEDDAYGKDKLRITGVPFFLVDSKFSIAGCQETAAFQQAFEKALAR
ncbi:unnamed protein product [Closterium sp. NIES-53]